MSTTVPSMLRRRSDPKTEGTGAPSSKAIARSSGDQPLPMCERTSGCSPSIITELGLEGVEAMELSRVSGTPTIGLELKLAHAGVALLPTERGLKSFRRSEKVFSSSPQGR
eukprot:CAMPEP_0182809772 /NCGR_PEP_ID=MMETSP0006_2-20121128/7367_1 /TAXON_ID=97485 /ORGANISM="Prymnesium parvum, Strain Texoma1" /LENGTH=110 /DNA_ID=CAMNT_0024935589 /DNA_START=532 /DNA_END=860 /DNA_ORIENTATION=+